MKKVLSIVATLAALAGTASAAPYVLPSPQTGALTPYDMQPHYALDAIYSIADDSEFVNMYGVRGSFNLYTSGADLVRHQFNINVAGMMGNETKHIDGSSVKVDAYTLPITAGYDLNVAVCDEVLLFLGGKAGYSFVDIKEKCYGETYKTNKGGFTFSVGGGLKVQCSEAVMLKLGYEFGRTYVDASGDKFNFGQHSIIAGVSVQF